MTPLGHHLLLELYDCRPALLDDAEGLSALAVEAVRASGGTVLEVRHRRFEPQGVTVFVLVAESHLALHTWPERGYVGVDYFTCGTRVDPRVVAAMLLERLAPARHDLRVVPRGDAFEELAPPAGGAEPAAVTALPLYDTPDFALAADPAAAAPQVAFVRACAERFGPAPLESGVELACGGAPLSVALAAQGLRMTAVDGSAAMLAVARRHAADRGVRVALVHADMASFRAEPPVDVVTNLGLNCSYLLSNEALRRHLDAVADSLRPGGLYLADFEHCLHRLPPPVRLEPPWLVYAGGPLYALRSRGIEMRFADGEIRYDPIRQRFRTWNTILRDGAAPRSVPSEGKLYLPLEVRALVEQTRRFEILGWYRDYHLDAPFDGHPEADRFVIALRHRG